MKIAFVGTVLLFLSYIHTAESSKILMTMIFGSKSQKIIYLSLAEELAKRGHEVTLVTPFKPSKTVKGLKEVVVHEMGKVLENIEVAKNLLDNADKAGFMKEVTTIQVLANITQSFCKTGWQQKELHDLYGSNDHYDLVIHSPFFNECFLHIAHKTGAPLMYLSVAGVFPSIQNAMMNSDPLAYCPVILSPFSNRMTFLQRLANVVIYWMFSAVHKFVVIPSAESIARPHVAPEAPHVADINNNVSFVLLYNHFSLDYPRPYLPNMVEVGGMHIKSKVEPLPKDMEAFVQSSGDEGFIYFSLGSAFKGSFMPEKYRRIFAEAFGELRQTVLWKYETEQMDNLPKNVRLGKWFPQQDILAHPKLRLFITHGGLSSTMEAAYHGVPVIGLPILGDQDLNMKKTEALKCGLRLEWKDLSKDKLLPTIREVINYPMYRMESQRRSSLFRDQIDSPLDRAVFWTEYMIRHNGAPHLRSAARELYWFQYYLLDVAAMFITIILLIVYIIKLLVRLLCRLVCYKSKPAVEHKKKTKKKKAD